MDGLARREERSMEMTESFAERPDHLYYRQTLFNAKKSFGPAGPPGLGNVLDNETNVVTNYVTNDVKGDGTQVAKLTDHHCSALNGIVNSGKMYKFINPYR